MTSFNGLGKYAQLSSLAVCVNPGSDARPHHSLPKMPRHKSR